MLLTSKYLYGRPGECHNRIMQTIPNTRRRREKDPYSTVRQIHIVVAKTLHGIKGQPIGFYDIYFIHVQTNDSQKKSTD